MPLAPDGKVRPVKVPNCAVGAAAPVAVKSTLSHAGLPVALRLQSPTLCPDVPQSWTNWAMSVSLDLKTLFEHVTSKQRNNSGRRKLSIYTAMINAKK